MVINDFENVQDLLFFSLLWLKTKMKSTLDYFKALLEAISRISESSHNIILKHVPLGFDKRASFSILAAWRIAC